jgi:hypothetical protein
MLNNSKIRTFNGVDICFTGIQLNQYDHNLFMYLVYLANNKPYRSTIEVSGCSILSALGKSNAGINHDLLRASLHRLASCSISIKSPISFIGGLVDSARQSLTPSGKNGSWLIDLNPYILSAFSVSDRVTFINWDQRLQLSNKPLSSFLHAFYSTHEYPFGLKVSTLYELSGCKSSQRTCGQMLRTYKQALKISLNDLVNINFLSSNGYDYIKPYIIDSDNIVYVNRTTKDK